MPSRKLFTSLPRYFFCLTTLLCSSYASAVFIDFDDIERNEDPFWAAHELTDEYLGKGLLIDGGFLSSYDPDSADIVSGPNYLQGGPYFDLLFVGSLPRFVSMIVSSSHEDAVHLTARLGDGSTLSQKVEGWEGTNPDYIQEKKKLITFTSDFGISQIDISAFYFLRTSARIDDLEYHYDVPEPGSLALFLAGMLALMRRRRA